MLIEIWSDVVCPWCYIGLRRLQHALAEFPHADEVELVPRSFQLDPSAPAVATETVVAMLARKYAGGDAEAARKMVGQTDAIAAGEGLRFDHADAPHVNTETAHRLLQLAADDGLALQLDERLLAGYFTERADLGDHATLARLAGDVGLDPERVRTVLESEEFADRVAEQGSQAAAFGATGVPFFVFDRRLAVAGAQPTAVFAQALQQAWDAAPERASADL